MTSYLVDLTELGRTQVGLAGGKGAHQTISPGSARAFASGEYESGARCSART